MHVNGILNIVYYFVHRKENLLLLIYNNISVQKGQKLLKA